MKCNWFMLWIAAIMIGAAIQFWVTGNKPAAGMMFFVAIGNFCGAFI